MRHLVTGATGFVGGAIALELLDRTADEVVCLVRGADDGTATARLHDALLHAAQVYDRPDLRDAVRERARGLAGDVTEPGCGLTGPPPEGIGQVWHAAGSLKFADRHAAEIDLMNITGTGHVIALAEELGAELDHVSTAYVAGGRTGPVAERVEPGPANNHYEISKIEAERMVTAASVPWRILRPSIVIGHSRTLAATTFSGMYGFLSALLVFRLQVEQHFGQMLRFRSVPIFADPAAELNLVPVDLVARDAVAAGLAGPAGAVYHLTNATAPTVGEALPRMLTACGLREPRFVDGRGRFTSIDRRLDDGLTFYSSYLRHGKTFDRANIDAVRGPAACALPPEVIAEYVEWYLTRIRLDGRRTAPKPHSSAFRRRTPAAAR